MPIFFQHQINDSTRLGIWKIEETEEFFISNVPVQKQVTHPHKRLQHLAGRFLLQFLFPGFPYELIKIADTLKPYLAGEQYHFSISHCADFAAAIVSSSQRVGIDVEVPSGKAEKIKNRFLSKEEQRNFHLQGPGLDPRVPTLLWCCKESVYKWYGDGGVDFRRHIRLARNKVDPGIVDCFFEKINERLTIHNRFFDHLVLAWITS